jgi:hypothetical protein
VTWLESRVFGNVGVAQDFFLVATLLVGSFQFQALVLKHVVTLPTLLSRTYMLTYIWNIYMDISVGYPEFFRGISSRGIYAFRYPEDTQLVVI